MHPGQEKIFALICNSFDISVAPRSKLLCKMSREDDHIVKQEVAATRTEMRLVEQRFNELRLG